MLSLGRGLEGGGHEAADDRTNCHRRRNKRKFLFPTENFHSSRKKMFLATTKKKDFFHPAVPASNPTFVKRVVKSLIEIGRESRVT